MNIISNYHDCIDYLIDCTDKKHVLVRKQHMLVYNQITNTVTDTKQKHPVGNDLLSYSENKVINGCICFLDQLYYVHIILKSTGNKYNNEPIFNIELNQHAKDIPNTMINQVKSFNKADWFLMFYNYNYYINILNYIPINKFIHILPQQTIEQLYQQIEQYVWKNLDVQTSQPINDKVKVQLHGFNQHSFRNVR